MKPKTLQLLHAAVLVTLLAIAASALTAPLTTPPSSPGSVPTQRIETECRQAQTVLQLAILLVAQDPEKAAATLNPLAEALQHRNSLLYTALYAPLLTALVAQAHMVALDPAGAFASVGPQLDAACVAAMKEIT